MSVSVVWRVSRSRCFFVLFTAICPNARWVHIVLLVLDSVFNLFILVFVISVCLLCACSLNEFLGCSWVLPQHMQCAPCDICFRQCPQFRWVFWMSVYVFWRVSLSRVFYVFHRVLLEHLLDTPCATCFKQFITCWWFVFVSSVFWGGVGGVLPLVECSLFSRFPNTCWMPPGLLVSDKFFNFVSVYLMI
jgi:hypothetical protein